MRNIIVRVVYELVYILCSMLRTGSIILFNFKIRRRSGKQTLCIRRGE
jgi:hypothetical protein